MFGQCLVMADGAPVLRASGTFRYSGEPDQRFDRVRRLLAAQDWLRDQQPAAPPEMEMAGAMS